VKYTLKEHQAKKMVPTDLQEYVGKLIRLPKESVTQLNESAKGKQNRKLIVQMEAIHVGRTANYTYYTKEGLSAGLDSWTHPYNKPVLTHHNDYDGEPIGRILKAEFSENTKSGKPGLVFTVEITDPVAIEKVLDGRYSTVSIGATTDKVTCNICGTDRTQEWCEHYPGEEYDGQKAHFIIGTTFGKEVSYVNVPADSFAGNTSVEMVEDDNPSPSSSSKESVNMEVFQVAEGLLNSIKQPTVNLFEHLNDDLKHILRNLTMKEGEPSMPTENQTNSTAPSTEPAIPATGKTQEGVNNENPKVTESETENQAATEPSATTSVQEATNEVLQMKINEMQSTITNLVMEKQKLDARLVEAEGEVSRLTAENADLLSQIHKHLAEKVVDIKRKLNKPDVVGVTTEEAIANHVTRTKESLENSLADLTAELSAARPESGSVKNPGYTNESDDSKAISVEEAASILSSMFSPKRRK